MELSLLLITLGCLVLAGLAIDVLGGLTHVPRITLLVLLGLAIGPHGAGLLPINTIDWYEIVAKISLTMIAFLLGGELSRASLRLHGRAILAVSVAVTLASVLLVAGGLLAVGVPVALALLLAGIGLATAPAATRDVIREVRADGPLTRTVLGVVAIDDAWGIIVFSIVLGFVASGTGDGISDGLVSGLGEILGAMAVGLLVGLPAAWATGRIQPGEPTLSEALGIVLLCAGLSLWLEVSFLLAGMTAGAVIVNLAGHHERAFHEIEHISWPFLIVFFVLAGASVDIRLLAEVGTVGVAFMGLRVVGRIVGGWIGGRLGGLPDTQSRRIGLALTPQAGVALGMALVASEAAPAVGEQLLAITVATTVVFELVGPILTRAVLRWSGEAGRRQETGESG